MAKYGRYDPRNKKRNKHKYESLDKDLRIRALIPEEKQYSKYEASKLTEIVEYDDDQDLLKS